MEARAYPDVSPTGYGYRWSGLQFFINAGNNLATPNVQDNERTLELEHLAGSGFYTGQTLIHYLARNKLPAGDSHDVSSHGPFSLILRNSAFLSDMLYRRANALYEEHPSEVKSFTNSFNICFTGDLLATVLANPTDSDAVRLLGSFLSWQDAPSVETFVTQTRQAAENFEQPAT